MMTPFKTFIRDPKDAEEFWSDGNPKGSNFFGFFDLSFMKQVHEFLTKGNEGIGFESFQTFIDSHCKLCDSVDDKEQTIAGGVALLYAFIQKNWLAPEVQTDDRIIQMSRFESRENVLKQLVVDGENIIPVVDLTEVLLVSKVILERACYHFENSLASRIWYLRCLFIHQQVLEELSPELCDKLYDIIEKIKKELKNATKDVIALCHLEFARIYLYYQNVHKSKIEIEKAREVLGIEISLSGAFGKRTKFQTKDLAQLILKINLEGKENFNGSPVTISSCTQPKDVKLDDEVRLDRIKYSDNVDYPDLTDLQQALLLGNLFQIQKSQPKDNLADEELQPLIDCILQQPKVWSFRMTTLLLRSELESNHKRTVERAMMQVQVLSDSLKESGVDFKPRFKYFFISYLPPKWHIQSTLAKIMASMGSIKTALEIFQSLEEWESVIYCYNALQLRHKAQGIIEQELKKNPTPKLWCLLGDATDDVSCYEKAWELSNRRSARAQRHWAYFYYYRKNYTESIEHFQMSLEINSLQKELWYRLGYAALVEEKWEIGAHAYRRYCVLDPECFEAWNNLARCYCELKQKYRAWRALQEALKVDYSNWKVWDNYMLVSSDLQAFDEVIKSYHEILNLKEKHLDIPVLNSLVVGLRNMKDGEGSEAEKMDGRKFREKLLKLFGRLTSQVINDGELWFLYSEVVDADSPESLAKKHQLLMKAHRSAINKPDWETKLENCNRIIYVLSKAVEVGLQTENPNTMLSCKLAVAGALAKIKKLHPDAGICEPLENNLGKLDEILGS